MPATFWSNTIWFLLLGITTIIELILIFKKAEKRKLVLAFYITITGLTFAFEMIIVVLNAYQYFPKAIPPYISQTPAQYLFNDSIIGNYFSQFSISATALLIAVYNLNYYWFLAFAGAYCIIEEFFLELGIYTQNWYRTWMTFVLMLLLFWVVKKIYDSSYNKHIKRVWRYLYIFFGLYSLHVHTMWFFELLGIHNFGRSFEFTLDEGGRIIIIVIIYTLVVGSIIMAVYFMKSKWWWKATVILLLYIAHYTAAKLGLMIYKEGWFTPFTTIAIFSMYLYTYILDKLYVQTKQKVEQGTI